MERVESFRKEKKIELDHMPLEAKEYKKNKKGGIITRVKKN